MVNTGPKPLIQISGTNFSDSRLKSIVEKTKKKHAAMFAETLALTTVCSMINHRIDTGNHQPIWKINERGSLQKQV